MYFKNKAHRDVFIHASQRANRNDRKQMCKLYLLTADRALWRAAKRQMWNGKIILGRIRLACGVISPKLFKIIETAVAIRRYGINEILTIE